MSLRVFICLIYSVGIWLSLSSSVLACRQPEGLTYVGSMNRTQQAYYLEKNTFAKNLKELAAGIPEETTIYSYKIVKTPHGVLNFGTYKNNQLRSNVRCEWKCNGGILWPFNTPSRCGIDDSDYLFCTSRYESCRGGNYVGAVYLKKINNQLTTSSILCTSGLGVITVPIFEKGDYICDPNSKEVR
jgi:hypothetical protein